MATINAYMITTIDNPFDPVTQYKEWLNYDENVLHYGTNEYLARVARTFPDMTVKEYWEEKGRAIDDIIKTNGTDLYKKITVPLT